MRGGATSVLAGLRVWGGQVSGGPVVAGRPGEPGGLRLGEVKQAIQAGETGGKSGKKSFWKKFEKLFR